MPKRGRTPRASAASADAGPSAEAAEAPAPPRHATSGAFRDSAFVQPQLIRHFVRDGILPSFTPSAPLIIAPAALAHDLAAAEAAIDFGTQVEPRGFLSARPTIALGGASVAAGGGAGTRSFTLVVADVDAPSPWSPEDRS
jgi:hypothetical protein